MPSIKIVGLGMACLDILIRAGRLPTWRKGGVINTVAIEGGGPVATALVAAQRLGVSTGFIGTYGNDRLGEIKIKTLIDSGVDVRYALRCDKPENQVVLVAVNKETGDRIFSGVQGEYSPLSLSEIEREYILQADYLHLDGYHIAAAFLAARWMKYAGKKVMLDGSATRGPVTEKMIELIKMVDYLICGTGFGPAATGKKDLWIAGKAMIAMGPQVVVQTEGKNGSYTTTSDQQFHTPAFEVDVIDTTGAGDVFHGAFLVGLLKGWDVQKIVVFSTAVAAIKCTQFSGRRGIPTFAEAKDFLKKRGYDL
jgi:sulfofructose kinase